MSKRPDYESVKGCWDDSPRQQNSGCSIAVAVPVLVALLVGAVSRGKADR